MSRSASLADELRAIEQDARETEEAATVNVTCRACDGAGEVRPVFPRFAVFERLVPCGQCGGCGYVAVPKGDGDA